MAVDRFGVRKKMIGQVLKEMRLVHEGQIQEALGAQKRDGGRIGQALVRMGAITEDQLMVALGRQAGLEVIDLKGFEPQKDAVAKVDETYARPFQLVPVSFDGKTLVVAMADAMNKGALDDIRFTGNCEVKGVVAEPGQVAAAIEKAYGKETNVMASILKEIEEGGLVPAKGKHAKRTGTGGAAVTDLEDVEEMANAAPVRKLLNYILYQAIRDRASDIHLEPFEDEFKIRYRVDGVLYELEAPPLHLATALISRVKVMSGLDISETRVPQDGRIDLAIGGRPVDLRISTLPTMFGESCVMRVLDRSVVSLDLTQIGLREGEVDKIKGMIDLPHGIILVTGPTGSGKTTTLYSALNQANDVSMKIITTEDPVEYDLEGIVQVQINEEVGVTYAACLRSILRQDPDMILVGEIRDKETAQISIEASLTGHVVFSTLHTNDAPLAITRLVDIGVEPFLIAATLEGVVGQRLVRRICVECKTWYEPSVNILRELDLAPEQVVGKKFAYGKGCAACNRTGYRGRVAIFEIMVVSDAARELIMDKAPTSRLRELARREGMRTLRESGLLAIYDGVTTVEEVLRET
ncbi:MAG TPA: ATPase, T2SS/T4P/T4SS family, partial [Planctomycetota bacterium]|nr:ATPase, T2SS/T4P/T4SS family [Planctomycetota bacterium]